MTYVLALCGAALAIGGGVWYAIRRLAQDRTAISSLTLNSEAKDKRIKTLDDRIVDSEYQRRIEEKLRNAKIVSMGDAGTAGGLLARKPGPGGGN